MHKPWDDLVGQWVRFLLGLGRASQWAIIPYMYFKGRSRNLKNGGGAIANFSTAPSGHRCSMLKKLNFVDLHVGIAPQVQCTPDIVATFIMAIRI